MGVCRAGRTHYPNPTRAHQFHSGGGHCMGSSSGHTWELTFTSIPTSYTATPLPAHTWQSTFNSIPSFYLPHPCWASTETLSPIDLKYDTVSVTHITHTAFIKPYIFCHPYNSPIHTERGQIHFTSSLQFSNINLGQCSSHTGMHSV